MKIGELVHQNGNVFSSMRTLSIFPSPLSTSMAWSPGAITWHQNWDEISQSHRQRQTKMIVSQLLKNKVAQWLSDRLNGPPIQLIKIRIMAIFVQWYQYHGPASSSARPGYQPTPCFHKNGPRWALRCWTTIKSCTNFHVWVINMRIIVYHGDYLCVSILFLFAPRPYSWIWIAAARSLVYKSVIVTLVLLWSLLPHISILRP